MNHVKKDIKKYKFRHKYIQVDIDNQLMDVDIDNQPMDVDVDNQPMDVD